METLNSHSLMLGDWVCTEHDSTPRQIDWIRGGEIGLFWNKVVTPPYLKPIPLTQEILEKNGFEKKKISDYKSLFCIVSQNYDYLYVSWIGIPEFSIGSSFDEDDELQEFATIRYVHELQHALRLCGIEKEIEL